MHISFVLIFVLYVVDGKPKHIQFGQFIASNVPSLELFFEESSNKQTAATLRALSSAMLLLQRFSLKI